MTIKKLLKDMCQRLLKPKTKFPTTPEKPKYNPDNFVRSGPKKEFKGTPLNFWQLDPNKYKGADPANPNVYYIISRKSESDKWQMEMRYAVGAQVKPILAGMKRDPNNRLRVTELDSAQNSCVMDYSIYRGERKQ